MVVEQLWQPVPGGSGTYVVELARALRDRPDVALRGIAARHAGPPPDAPDLGPLTRRSALPRRLLYPAWQYLGVPRAEHVLPELDVCHATTWAVPPTRRPLVVTVHDVAFLDRPDHFTAHGLTFFHRALAQVVRRADAVIVPSEATARRCAEVGLGADRVHVVPHGAPSVPDADPADDAPARLGVRRPYVMWAGTVEPRKNLPNVVAAYTELARDPDAPDLVLVGPSGWGELPEIPPHLRGRVHVTGRVDVTDLHALYAGAEAFVFPSWDEGFGLPVLEAMAHGTPVVTSRGTACEEVLGGGGLVADPGDPGEIARALATVLGTGRDAIAARARARAATFTWQRAADLTVEAYRAAARNG